MEKIREANSMWILCYRGGNQVGDEGCSELPKCNWKHILLLDLSNLVAIEAGTLILKWSACIHWAKAIGKIHLL